MKDYQLYKAKQVANSYIKKLVDYHVFCYYDFILNWEVSTQYKILKNEQANIAGDI